MLEITKPLGSDVIDGPVFSVVSRQHGRHDHPQAMLSSRICVSSIETPFASHANHRLGTQQGLSLRSIRRRPALWNQGVLLGSRAIDFIQIPETILWQGWVSWQRHKASLPLGASLKGRFQMMTSRRFFQKAGQCQSEEAELQTDDGSVQDNYCWWQSVVDAADLPAAFVVGSDAFFVQQQPLASVLSRRSFRWKRAQGRNIGCHPVDCGGRPESAVPSETCFFFNWPSAAVLAQDGFSLSGTKTHKKVFSYSFLIWLYYSAKKRTRFVYTRLCIVSHFLPYLLCPAFTTALHLYWCVFGLETKPVIEGLPIELTPRTSFLNQWPSYVEIILTNTCNAFD